MARAIDGDELLGITRLLDTDVVRQSKTASWLLDQVLHDIQAMPTLTPPNEPLTLEQLREMNGEPVWVTSARERGNIPSRWVLFAGVSKSKRNSDVFVFATTGGIGQGYEAVNYGKTWNAYCRPPEGEEDT